MDERVERAIQQWPDVPDVYGWLSLDARGRWKLRGEPITNSNLIGFINRNYGRTPIGSYAFQNGPQRVHVQLEATPWVAHIVTSDAPSAAFQLHTGEPVTQVDKLLLASSGAIILSRRDGPAIIHDQDLHSLPNWLLDRDGQALDDATLEQALQSPQEHGLQLKTDLGLKALQQLPDEPLENVFNYIARPKAAR